MIAYYRLSTHGCEGLSSLFLHNPQDDTTKTSPILEVQAISPTNARSWFLGEEVVAGALCSPQRLAHILLNALAFRWKAPGDDTHGPHILAHVSFACHATRMLSTILR